MNNVYLSTGTNHKMKNSTVHSTKKHTSSGETPRKIFPKTFGEAGVGLVMPDRQKAELVSIFDDLSKKNQGKLRIYAESLKKIEELEKEAQHKLEPVVVNEKVQQVLVGDNSEKRKKRSHAQDTVRRNYSLSEKMANAIQEASQSMGITASLYVEKVMKHQPEVIKSLGLESINHDK